MCSREFFLLFASTVRMPLMYTRVASVLLVLFIVIFGTVYAVLTLHRFLGCTEGIERKWSVSWVENIAITIALYRCAFCSGRSRSLWVIGSVGCIRYFTYPRFPDSAITNEGLGLPVSHNCPQLFPSSLHSTFPLHRVFPKGKRIVQRVFCFKFYLII